MGRAERRRELKKNEKLKKPPVYNYTPESLMGQLKYEARGDRKATSSDVRGYGSITGGSKETDPGCV